MATMTNVTLQEVNDEKAVLLVPAMLFVGLTMLVGLFGNVLVVYVFPFKLSSGTQNTLITSLAVFDLLACLIAMPTEITDMRFFFMFESEFACKMLRFVNSFCAMCSIMVLLGIAMDRYRKVCKPHQKQLGPRQVKIVILISVLLATFFAWPALVLYGKRSADTGVPGLTGTDCSTSDSVVNTLYPLIYNGILAIMFIVIATVLCVLYVLVWKTAKKHTEISRQTTIGPRGSAINTIELSSADSESGPSRNSTSKPRGTRRRSNKTTTIAFLVSIVFILSFLPYLCLSIARALVKGFDYNLNDVGLVFFNLFLRSYFVNSAANPIIYGVMNIRFRRESCKVLTKVLCCGRR